MCWNADISLNTFLFSCFVLTFIYLTNTYSRYKTPMFDHPLVYAYLGLIASMQLIEFFVWRNLHNKRNNTWSEVATVNVTFQPVILLCMIPEPILRYSLLGLYAIYILLYRAYKYQYNPFVYHTSVKNNHLRWDWTDATQFERGLQLVYLAFYVAAFLLIKNPLLCLFGLASMVMSFYFYWKDDTFGSMWCWALNLFLLYFIVNILLVQPFIEYNGLC